MRVVDTRRLHNERVTFPAPHRVAKESGWWLFEGRLFAHMDGANQIVFFDSQENLIAVVDELHRIGILHDERHALRRAVRGRLIFDRVPRGSCFTRVVGQRIVLVPQTARTGPHTE